MDLSSERRAGRSFSGLLTANFHRRGRGGRRGIRVCLTGEAPVTTRPVTTRPVIIRPITTWFFRPFGACSFFLIDPPLARWAAFFRSCGAGFVGIAESRGLGCVFPCRRRLHASGLGWRFPIWESVGCVEWVGLGIGGGALVHGPTVADLKSRVKVARHKEKIKFCGKLLWVGSRGATPPASGF